MMESVSDNFATKNYDFKITEYADGMIKAVKYAGLNPTLDNMRLALIEMQAFCDSLAIRNEKQATEKEELFEKPLEELDFLLNGDMDSERYIRLMHKYNAWLQKDKRGNIILMNGHALYLHLMRLRNNILNYAIRIGYLLYKQKDRISGFDKYKQSMIQ